jgi:2-C-methyl-D-erythritol 4-phosphate cytidylyltransferase
MKIKVVAIVPAAGLGKRFDISVRKPFAKVADIPLLIYTLKRLHEAKSITEIIPVLRQEDMEMGLGLIESHNLNKVKQVTPGGKERQDSVYNALGLIKKDCLILIHDGVRPLISTELIERLLQEVKGVDGVAPGLSMKETLKEVNTKGFVLATVKRGKFWTIQTPQVFPFKVIKNAYDKAYTDGFYATDDAALVERIGGKVKIIKGEPFNIKVTTPEDMDIVEYVLTKKNL